MQGNGQPGSSSAIAGKRGPILTASSATPQNARRPGLTSLSKVSSLSYKVRCCTTLPYIFLYSLPPHFVPLRRSCCKISLCMFDFSGWNVDLHWLREWSNRNRAASIWRHQSRHSLTPTSRNSSTERCLTHFLSRSSKHCFASCRRWTSKRNQTELSRESFFLVFCFSTSTPSAIKNIYFSIADTMPFNNDYISKALSDYPLRLSDGSCETVTVVMNVEL